MSHNSREGFSLGFSPSPEESGFISKALLHEEHSKSQRFAEQAPAPYRRRPITIHSPIEEKPYGVLPSSQDDYYSAGEIA